MLFLLGNSQSIHLINQSKSSLAAFKMLLSRCCFQDIVPIGPYTILGEVATSFVVVSNSDAVE